MHNLGYSNSYVLFNFWLRLKVSPKVSPVFSLFLLINMILLFTYNFHGLIENCNPELLPLESESLTITSCVFHIYNYNYSSSSSISQPNKNIAFLDFIRNYVKVSLLITSALLQVTTKIYETLWQKSVTNYSKIYYHKLWQLKLLQIIDDYYKLR